MREAARMDALTEISVKIGSVVHELQKERGATALFLGSRGTRFNEEVNQIRKSADTQINSLQNALQKIQPQAFGATFVSRLGNARLAMGKLPEMRQSASEIKTTIPEHLGRYTGLIKSLLDVAGQLPEVATDPGLAATASAWQHLMVAKECAGQERATLSAAFAADRFQ